MKTLSEEEKNYLFTIVEGTKSALLLAGTNVFWSWGVSKLVAFYYEEMPTLAIRVQGFLHQGWVYVSYNVGFDLYEVRIIDDGEVVKKVDEVYFDELAGVVDALVERDPTWSDEEYEERVNAVI